jgi:hypothetical protein
MNKHDSRLSEVSDPAATAMVVEEKPVDSPYINLETFKEKACKADTLVDTMLLLGPNE